MKCEHCGKRFSKNFNLKRHINFKHGGSLNKNGEIDLNNINGELNENCNQTSDGISKINARSIFDCNLSQKTFYKNSKINHHFNKVNLN